MKRFYTAAAVIIVAVAPITKADDFSIGVNAASHVSASSNFAPGFPNSSWQAGDAGQKSEFYIAASSIFSGAVTIDEIQSISYWTNKPGNSGSPDWTFYMYTAPTGSGDEASWYHTRLNSEPYLSNTPAGDDPANTWHKWSTNNPTSPMRFYDFGRDGNVYGTYSDPTLADLQAGSINWNAFYSIEPQTNIDYGPETIETFSLQTGSGWTNFDGLVDGVTIALTDGRVANLNFEATPEPTSWILLGTLAFGFVAAIRHRHAHGRG